MRSGKLDWGSPVDFSVEMRIFSFFQGKLGFVELG